MSTTSQNTNGFNYVHRHIRLCNEYVLCMLESDGDQYLK